MKIKQFILLSSLLISGPLFTSCSSNSDDNSVVVYRDDRDVKIGDLYVKINQIDCSRSYSKSVSGYKARIALSFTNKSENKQNIIINNSFISSEVDGASFTSTVSLDKNTIESNETTFVNYEVVTPVPLIEDKYSLSTIINDTKYLLHLYNRPDNQSVDFLVKYHIADQTVHSLLVKENKLIGEDYIYENPNHLTYCNVWKTSDGVAIGSSTKVNSDISASGVEKNNICFAQNEDEYIANSLDYIPSDKTVVVPSAYDNKSVTTIGENFFFSKSVSTIYLPKSITTIEKNNFYACSLLETINFEGTEEEWNAINNLSIDNILDTVTINFGISF